jgi:S-DNA-T family DNA segregation ATPase FtsK/SpoIIIE
MSRKSVPSLRRHPAQVRGGAGLPEQSGAGLPSSEGATPVTSALRLVLSFQRFAGDVGGLLMLALGMVTLLGLLNLSSGKLLIGWVHLLLHGLGWGSWAIPLVCGLCGIFILRRGSANLTKRRWGQVLWLEAAYFTSLGLLSLMGGHAVTRAEQGLDGGVVGWGVVELCGLLVRPTWLLTIVLSGVFLLSTLFGLDLVRPFVQLARKYLETPAVQPAIPAGGAGGVVRKPPEPLDAAADLVGAGAGPPEAARRSIPHLPVEFRKKFKVHLKEDENARPPERDARLPPVDLLLNEQSVHPDERNINLTAGLIEKTLAEFGIPAKVIGFRIGPTVTQFAVEPGFVEKPGSAEEEIIRQKVRVAQISGLARDLALALSAERLRIEAPVPGRPYVGVEVPNSRSAVVRMRPILENEAFYKFGSPLTIALGRDVSGQAVVADLARMPHLLIAGTTGSGKSICIAALTACLVMNNTPEDLRLVMVDPKMVELVRFNGLPHLYGKVETSLERILGVLQWTVAEMDQRYRLLEATRSRNIDSYNKKIRRRKGEKPMPRIVVMLDELADLMMSAPDQTEHTLVRLAQMARATGIHLVVATQRPSTDVVTGLIKANFPARIAFTVASSVDSRVILDTAGAEALLGRGDMLFLPPEVGSPLRAQGVMVTDQEIERIIQFWQQALPPEAVEPPWEELLRRGGSQPERDDLVIKAIAIVRETQRASASMLQRRLHIGYPRAARLVDELEELGVVGPAQPGGKERAVLLGPQDFDGG